MVTICFSPCVFTSCLTKKQASILPNIQENIITHEVGIPIHHFFHSFSPLLRSFSHFGPKITIAGEVQLREFQDFQTTFGRPDANGAIFWCLFRDDPWENSKLQEGNEWWWTRCPQCILEFQGWQPTRWCFGPRYPQSCLIWGYSSPSVYVPTMEALCHVLGHIFIEL